MIVVECDADEFLIRSLGFRRTKHEPGKGKVMERVRKTPGAIGIIDEDPDSDQPAEKLKYVELESKSTIKLLARKNSEYGMIIQISPKLEDWMFGRARHHHISPNEYGLPTNPNELHGIPHYERTIKFKKFINMLLEKDDEEIKTLKEWLRDYS